MNFGTNRAIIKGRERMKDKHGIGQAIVMITQLSINMLVPVFMCLFIGIWLDKQLGTGWLTLVRSSWYYGIYSFNVHHIKAIVEGRKREEG